MLTRFHPPEQKISADLMQNTSGGGPTGRGPVKVSPHWRSTDVFPTWTRPLAGIIDKSFRLGRRFLRREDGVEHMGETSVVISGLPDDRLAVYATAPTGAWLWSLDGARVSWANPAGCASFAVRTRVELSSRVFEPRESVRAQVARLAATLPQNGAVRLERLRGFGGHGAPSSWRPLVCACSLFRFDQTTGVLVTATETTGHTLSLSERVRRLDLDDGDAIAAFAPDGALLFATTEGERRLAGTATADDIGAASLCAAAVVAGTARGATAIGPVTIRRVGQGACMVLLARFEGRGAVERVAEPKVPDSDDVHAPVSHMPEPAIARGDEAAAAMVDLDGIGAAAMHRAERPHVIEPNIALRRHPLRFVWQMDPDGRFTLGSDEFTEIIGTKSSIALGRTWQEINGDLGLDPQARVAAAVATRETWSNITISWPVDGSAERLDVELAGLPAFDRDRNFLGYRGFGVCRDIGRIENLRAMRRLAMFPLSVAPGEMMLAAQPRPQGAKQGDNETARTAASVALNVVPFPGPAGLVEAKPGAELRSPALSPGEHSAFRELARQLTARLQEGDAPRTFDDIRERSGALSAVAEPEAAIMAAERAERPGASIFDDRRVEHDDHALLKRLPVGILIYRFEELLFANRAFLAMAGYGDLDALNAAGGLDALFVETGIGALADSGEAGQRFAITTRSGQALPVEGRLVAIHWNGEPAFAVLLAKAETNERIGAAEAAQRQAETQARDLRTMLDSATDGILVVDDAGRALSGNRGAEIMFGRGPGELVGTQFASLFAPQSRDAATRALARASADGGDSAAELTAAAVEGRAVRLLAILRRLGDDTNRIGVALREIAPERDAAPALPPKPPNAAVEKSAALTKLCHEARVPLNSILGFCEIMLEERFGPIGNDRYRNYIDDMREAGAHLMALLVDAVDLANIEAGTFHLSPAPVNLNDMVNDCVARMQPEANEARVVVRVSLSPVAHKVVADAEAVRQMLTNLLGHAIRSSRPGGQVIVSIGVAGDKVVLRLRDNGGGLTEKAVAAALEPAGPQATTPPWSSAGQTLPLTKALAEANHARFTITSRPNEGSLFELTFAAISNSMN
jgi:PAS domain S-box-containing protein